MPVMAEGLENHPRLAQLDPMLGLRAVLVVTVMAVLGVAALAAVHFGPRLYYRFVPPKADVHAVGDAETAAFAEAGRRFRGRIVWSSNRPGNHEIYLLDLRKKSPVLSRLTEDPHVDTFPRFSPDGKSILFNRSREIWVSDRDPGPWDVWLMDADGRHARRIAEWGFHPSFAPDGRAVLFARSATVVRHEIDGGGEEVLLDAGKALGGWGQEPVLRDHRIAATIRGTAFGAFGIYDLDARKFKAFPGDSCQIGWWPGQERVFWIEGHVGNGGTRVAWGPSTEAA